MHVPGALGALHWKNFDIANRIKSLTNKVYSSYVTVNNSDDLNVINDSN